MRIRSWLTNPIKLFTLLVLCFFGLNAVFLSVSGLLFYTSFNDIAHREVKAAKSELLQATSYQLSNYISGVEDTAIFLVTNEMIREHLLFRPVDFFDFHSKSKDIYDQFQRMLPVKEGLHSIELYTDRFRGYTPVQDRFLYSMEDAEAQGWASRLSEADGFWLPAYAYDAGASSPIEMVSYVHRIYGEAGQALGVVKINIPVRELFKVLSKPYPSSAGDDYYFIMDSSGRYIASTLPEGLAYRSGGTTVAEPERLAERLRERRDEPGTGSEEGEIGGRTYSAIHANPGRPYWQLSQLIARDVISADNRELRLMTAGMLVGLLLLSLPVIFWISRRLTRPIHGIVGGMNALERGDFTVRLDGSWVHEYQYLTSHFNRMVVRLKELIHQLNKEHNDRREAEMQLLQAQIKPHFLYNTLDLIHWRALDYKAHDISRMVHQLSKLFRIGLSNDKWYVAVKDELVHAECYMTIQKYRQNFPIEYRERVDRDLYLCLIPKIIIQPFLENAVIHAFRGGRSDARIDVAVDTETDENRAERLAIRIRDNGSGLPPNFEASAARGIGIRNVVERIQLYCGPQYGVELRAAEGGGAEAVIRLPLVRGEEDMERMRRSFAYENHIIGG